MDGNSPTPKQSSQKYWGNLGYFRKSHYMRRLRGWCFAITALCAIVAAATYHYWGTGRIFSKGPISQNHASFANDCRACHIDAEIDTLKAALSERPSGASLQTILTAGSSRDGKSAHWPAERSRMDEACLKCHANTALHAPQTAALALRNVSTEMAQVHATQCFTCHREHVGHGAIVPPDRQTCTSCHNSAEELRLARTSLPLKGQPVAATGENRDLGDGLIRFLAPAEKSRPVKPFADYTGHPPFSYEKAGLRDPADLKYNHARHERDDVTVLGPNKKLACADCHTPGPGGAYYQPVSYAKHCQQCHSLQILPDLPNLLIPHGDAQKVRYFLASIRVAIENALRAEGTTDAAELSKRAETEQQTLRNRGLDTLVELEQRVFFDGDPKDSPNDRRMRAGNRKFLTECAKCHTVNPAEPGKSPRVNPPNMAERWVQRGPFTHLPHTHMECADCHATAHTSKLTSDILMPPQKLCAECHRPPATPSPLAVASFKSPTPSTAAEALAAKQRHSGGIKWDCQSCHAFHAPAAPSPSAPANR